jgi:hypothetical protein
MGSRHRLMLVAGSGSVLLGLLALRPWSSPGSAATARAPRRLPDRVPAREEAHGRAHAVWDPEAIADEIALHPRRPAESLPHPPHRPT